MTTSNGAEAVVTASERITRSAALRLLDVVIRAVAALEVETPDHWLPEVLVHLTQARRQLEYSQSHAH